MVAQAPRVIVVMARSPEEERWAKPLGSRRQADPRYVLELHRALLERALAAAASTDGADVRLVTTGDLEAAREQAARQVTPGRLTVRAQSGGEAGGALGERIEAALDGALADGYRAA